MRIHSHTRHASRRLVAVAVLTAGAGLLLPVQNTLALNAVSFGGTTYTQNFDTLPYNTDGTDVALSTTPIINGTTYTLPAAGTPFDLSTSLSSSQITALNGWYGVGAAKDAYSANGGDNTQGGVYAFGAPGSSQRSLGLIAASGSGIDEVGVLLFNSTATTFNQITLSYTAELWHQGSTAKNLNFAYAVQSSATALPTSGLTAIPNLNTGSFATGTVQATNITSPAATNAINPGGLTISAWAPNSYLWLTWTINSSSGSGQGIGINDLSFSAANATPPATVTWNTTTGDWNISTGNWTGGSPTGNLYKNGDNAIFGNPASDSTVTVDAAGVSPGSVAFSNTSSRYTILGGPIQGAATVLSVTGGGTVFLGATNTYSGGTSLTAGAIQIDGGDRLGAGTIAISNNATLQSIAAAPITLPNNLTIGAGGATIDTGAQNMTVTSVSNLSGLLTKIGAGNLIVTGTFVPSTGGGVSVAAGNLLLNQTSGTINLGADGTLSGNLVLGGAVRLNINDSATLSGPAQIQLAASGALLSNTSGNTGGTFAAPILLNSTDPAGSSFIAGSWSGTTYTPASFLTTIGGTKGPTATPAIVAISGGVSGFSDVDISNDPVAGGGGGILYLNSQSNYTGNTTINANAPDVTGTGNVILGVDNALPITTGLIQGTKTGIKQPILDLNGHDQQLAYLADGANVTSAKFLTITNFSTTTDSVLTISGSVTPGTGFSGVIADGPTNKVSLVKDGSNTQTLTNANTYTGTTTIVGGTLALASNGSTTGSISTSNAIIVGDTPAHAAATLDVSALPSIHIVANQTLAGYGNVLGSITLDANSTLAPGNPAGPTGTLTIGSLTTNANATLAFKLTSAGASDSVHITGSLDVSAGGNISLLDSSAPQGYYQIIQYTSLTGTANALSLLTAPPNANQAYLLDTHHDAGFIDIHKVLIGDANGDGTVDGADFDIWFTHLLANTFDYGSGDFNGDGHVDGADFDIWFTHLLSTFSGTDANFPGFTNTQLSELADFLTPAQLADLPTGVPEPTTLAILGLAALVLIRRRHVPTEPRA